MAYGRAQREVGLNSAQQVNDDNLIYSSLNSGAYWPTKVKRDLITISAMQKCSLFTYHSRISSDPLSE